MLKGPWGTRRVEGEREERPDSERKEARPKKEMKLSESVWSIVESKKKRRETTTTAY